MRGKNKKQKQQQNTKHGGEKKKTSTGKVITNFQFNLFYAYKT